MANMIRTFACRITSRIRHQMSAITRDQVGSIMGLVAGALPILVGVLGLSVDAGLWYDNKRAVQTAADAAAVAATYRLAETQNQSPTLASILVSAAKADAKSNGFDINAPSTVTVNNPPLSGAYAGNPAAVEVILTDQRPLLFASLFTSGDVTVAARSVGLVKTTGTACVLALDESADQSVLVQGSTNLNMANCAIAANSNSGDAIDMSGSSTLTADTLWTRGDYSEGGSTNVTLAHTPETGTWKLPDPFEGTTVGSIGSCDAHNLTLVNATQTLSPGVYCGGINIGSNSVITLNPGTYYIDGGDLSVAATATLTCNCSTPGSGVTIVLTSSGSASNIGTVTINGGATVTLNAPTDPTAAYPGLLFFQDPRATTTKVSKFNGGSTMNLTGGIYFPSSHIQWSGNNSTGTLTCTQIVAKTVTFIGNSSLDNTGCAAAGINPIRLTGIALVE